MSTPEDTPDARKRRAEDLVIAMADRANLGAETLKLSNEFTEDRGNVQGRWPQSENTVI